MKWSIIIPAYNEEQLLGDCVRSVKHSAEKVFSVDGFEIIVTDNNSTDMTAQVARENGATVVFESHNQISRARNAGAAAAEGEYFIFLDADSIASPELFRRTRDCLEKRQWSGGGVPVSFGDGATRGAAAMLRFWNAIAAGLNLAAGSYVFCLAKAFKEIGGFSTDVYAGEEVYFSYQMRKWSRGKNRPFKHIRGGPPVVTSARKLNWHSYWKIWAVHLLLGFCPPLARSRKFCSFWYKRPGD